MTYIEYMNDMNIDNFASFLLCTDTEYTGNRTVLYIVHSCWSIPLISYVKISRSQKKDGSVCY